VLRLWSDQLGVFSHGTAMSLHELSDLLPDHIHMTLPESQRGRKRQTPPGLVLHFADLEDWAWHGNVPLTTPGRSLLDCVDSAMNPDLLEQGLNQAIQRGLLDPEVVVQIQKRLRQLRGLTP